MKLGKDGIFVVLMALLLPLASSHAKESAPTVKADSRETFMPVADNVREEMRAGGRFEFVTAQERGTIDKDLGQMQALFDKFNTVDGMDLATKIQLYNAQSEVNAILTRRDGDREICEYATPTGSNIPKTTCRKYSDIERNRRATEVMKDNMLHTILPSDRVSH
ncbi:hypothetical protein ACXU4B_06335 [Dyella soli]|uniref:Uncharacterized protein n=1 Tax=Dyella soli TaxID=522319 RepID=A0A4R0YUS7_9GAMM|nr:hypothetical protein [Dyella soli]TCI10608.1 hypothetical protein EZM97_17235 [Dyella soli]